MVRHALLLMLVASGVTSCVVMDNPNLEAPVERFVHRTANSEVVLLWNCVRPAPEVLRIEGVAQSPWQAQPIRYLELYLVGVDAGGRQTAEAFGKARDIQIRTNQRSPFLLELKTTGTEVRVDLYYQYLFDAEWDNATLAGSTTVVPRLYAQTKSNMVRDACLVVQVSSGCTKSHSQSSLT